MSSISNETIAQSSASIPADSVPYSGSSTPLDMSYNFGDFLFGGAASKQATYNQLLMDETNRKFTSAEALKNRQFQERMRDTAITSNIKQLKEAGLNPLLALKSLGSGGTVTGASASGSSGSAKTPSGNAGGTVNKILSALIGIALFAG